MLENSTFAKDWISTSTVVFLNDQSYKVQYNVSGVPKNRKIFAFFEQQAIIFSLTFHERIGHKKKTGVVVMLVVVVCVCVGFIP